MSQIHNSRLNTLRIAYTELMNAAERSPFIVITAIDAIDDWPAENYIVTYTCTGIARLGEDGMPELSDYHQMKLGLSSAFPASEPSLLWMTDIWHPNIHHQTHHVCTNAVENWYPQKSLTDFVVGIGEMIQYKHYFAEDRQPFPDDPAVAKWVREVAEPKLRIHPTRPVDPRPMLKEYTIRQLVPGGAKPETSPQQQEGLTPAPTLGIRLGKEKPVEAPLVEKPRIRLGRLV